MNVLVLNVYGLYVHNKTGEERNKENYLNKEKIFSFLSFYLLPTVLSFVGEMRRRNVQQRDLCRFMLFIKTFQREMIAANK